MSKPNTVTVTATVVYPVQVAIETDLSEDPKDIRRRVIETADTTFDIPTIKPLVQLSSDERILDAPDLLFR